MKYIDINWIHSFLDEPYRIVSELDDERFEVRKLEFYPNGAVGYAYNEVESFNTRLGVCSVPTLSEINENEYDEFCGKYITKLEFEVFWQAYASQRRCCPNRLNLFPSLRSDLLRMIVGIQKWVSRKLKSRTGEHTTKHSVSVAGLLFGLTIQR
ncbi:DUF6881 domain-containing protein [Vibrio profundum]|uniref:DUF6881 domain-containing protein n=1 Tax=Vibrio profundum TaxID=2910247 RepID=UPI003D0F89E2